MGLKPNKCFILLKRTHSTLSCEATNGLNGNSLGEGQKIRKHLGGNLLAENEGGIYNVEDRGGTS